MKIYLRFAFILLITGTVILLSLFPFISMNKLHDIIHDYSEPYDYELCIATRIKDVSKLVPQWIEFHLTAGVEHIYILNDCSRIDSFFWPVQFYSNDVTFIMNNTAFNCSNHDQMGVKEDTANIDYIFQKAKKHCQWVAVIDPDEYIFPSSDSDSHLYTNQNQIQKQESSIVKVSNIVEVSPLLYYLRSSKVLPVIRMPWYTFSTNGLETPITNELIVNTYTHGRYETVMKSMALSKYVVKWSDSHKPTKFQIYSPPKIDGLHLRDYTRSWNIKPSEMTLDIHGNCIQPKAIFYLRHFRVLNWQDHMKFRLSYKVGIFREFSQDNEDNERLKWESMNFMQPRDPLCPPLGEEYRLYIVNRMKISVRKRLFEYRLKVGLSHKNQVSSLVSTEDRINEDYLKWLEGTPLD